MFDKTCYILDIKIDVFFLFRLIDGNLNQRGGVVSYQGLVIELDGWEFQWKFSPEVHAY